MADAADLKSATRKGVGVRVPSWAPRSIPDCSLTFHLLPHPKANSA